MTKQKITQILRYLPFPVGIALLMTSVTGLIKYSEAASRYRSTTEPIIEKYVISNSVEGNNSLTADEKIEILSDLHNSEFDMDRNAQMPDTKYRFYIGLFLMLAGFSIFPAKSKKLAEQDVAPDG